MKFVLIAILVLLAIPLHATMYREPGSQFKPLVEVAAVYIEDKGKFLLLHRQDNKSQGNKWGIPGGKIDKGETPLQAVIRETKEETGYDISEQKIEKLETVFIEYSEKNHFVYHMFKVQLHDDPGKVKINYNEHKGFTWVTASDALKMDLMKDEDACIQLTYFPNK